MDSEQMRNYLLSGADDTPYEDMGKERAKQQWATGEVIRVLQEKAKEYERLTAALARLQLLKNHVEVWVGSSMFTVTIRDEQYPTQTMCEADGLTLTDACEGALAAYDKALGGVP